MIKITNGRTLSGETRYTKDAAEKLCGQIIEYWHKKGYHQVSAWFMRDPSLREADGEKDIKPLDLDECYVVRSNLINGLPPAVERGRVMPGVAIGMDIMVAAGRTRPVYAVPATRGDYD